MNSRPILFTAPMVRAILDGTKTQTRRLVKPQPPAHVTHCAYLVKSANHPVRPHFQAHWMAGPEDIDEAEFVGDFFECPHGEPGDELWVRETFANMEYACNPPTWTYRADTPSTDTPGWALPPGVKWKSPRFMPRAASRITLKVKAVRVERLQEISEADALAEGVTSPDHMVDLRYVGWGSWVSAGPGFDSGMKPSARAAFAELWDEINVEHAPWPSNPWVWVIKFERIKP